MRDWTVAFVNYNTADYLSYQLESYHRYNDPDTFQIQIIDNSDPHQKTELRHLQSQYPNTKVIFHQPIMAPLGGSRQHGEALTIIKEFCETKYLLTQDPDFFWLKRNILHFLGSFFEQGKIAVGSPFYLPPTNGDPFFPYPYGSAYLREVLEDYHFRPGENPEDPNQDVGWEIRVALSARPSHYFRRTDATLPFLGNHSYLYQPHSFWDGSELVATHLLRGSFMDFPHQPPTSGMKPPTPWTEARKAYCEYFKLYMNQLSGSQ